MTQKTDSRPLYKVLNEQRTRGEWDISPFKQGLIGLSFDDPIKSVGVGQFFGATPNFNAQYTALAVNNLASLAEELQGFIDNVIDDPKLCKNQISFYTGRFREALQRIS